MRVFLGRCFLKVEYLVYRVVSRRVFLCFNVRGVETERWGFRVFRFVKN